MNMNMEEAELCLKRRSRKKREKLALVVVVKHTWWFIESQIFGVNRIVLEPQKALTALLHSKLTSKMGGGKPQQQRVSWTPEEDRMLLDLIRQHGPRNWSQIAEGLEGRVGKQCRERWRNHLDPSIRRDPFTSKEDESEPAYMIMSFLAPE